MIPWVPAHGLRTLACLLRTLAFALLAAALVPVAAHAVPEPYFTSTASQEAVPSEMVNHPAAVRSGHTLYVAWQGPAFEPYIATYDESSHVWSAPVRIGPTQLRLDAHGAPSVFIDPDGYVHVLYGGHWTAICHAVSLQPNSISGFRELPAVAEVGTYPQAIQLPGGRLVVFFRQSTGQTGWVSCESTNGGQTWTTPSLLVHAPPSGIANWYLHAEAGSNGTILCSFLRREPATLEWLGRHDVYYIWRDDGGTWRNVRGQGVTVPVTVDTASETLVYFSGDDVVNEIVVREEPTSSPTPVPMIQFLTGFGRGIDAYSWKFARWAGTSWAFSNIAGTDHGFDAGTFAAHADGTVDSWVVAGNDPASLSRSNAYEGRGGTLQHFRSLDRGASWQPAERVSPEETGTIYSVPQIVDGTNDDPRLLFSEWTNDTSVSFQRLFLWTPDGFAGTDVTPTVERLAGKDRVGTAVAVSREAFPGSAKTVVIATSLDFPDALAGAPLAYAVHGPLLLVPRSLPGTVAAEVRRLGATRAILLGSTRALPAALVTQLQQQTGITTIERVQGPDRYSTALKIASRLSDELGALHTAVVVSGRNFPDALSAAPYAAWAGYPIVLARGDAPDAASLSAFQSLAVTSTIVVGSSSAVSTGFASGLPSPLRIEGADRFATSEQMARYSLEHGLLAGKVVMASGANFPDALSGGVLAARARACMLLVNPTSLPAPSVRLASDIATRTTALWVLGSPKAVADDSPLGDVRQMMGLP